MTPSLPYPSPKNRSCHRCGSRLNHYGVCPNQAKHLAEDNERHNKLVNEKRKKEEAFQALLDSIFQDKDKDETFFKTPHTHAWEPYGKGMYCCKVCGIIVPRDAIQE